jgi:hypothetical protein
VPTSAPRASYLYDLLHPGLVNVDRFIALAQGTGKKKFDKERLELPSVAWQEMAQDWQVVRDILGGTRGMRMARERWLPKFARESSIEYQHRLETSFLVDMLGDTIDEMISKPFSKGLSFVGDLPEWVEELNEDVDGEGTSIHEFAKNLLKDALTWGKSHIAVDAIGFPEKLPDEPQVRDFEGVRPRMRMVQGPNMLSWRRAPVRGRPINEVRFYERVIDATEITELLHIWTDTTMAESERDFQNDTFGDPVARTNPIKALPIVTLYANRTAEFMGAPPFMDIAWLNVDHWQSYSDQRQNLHLARIPLLFRKGFSSEEVKKGPVVVGSRRVHSTNNPNADMRYVEVSGAAMAQGDIHLKGLQDAAREKGAKPLYARGPVTATGEYRADQKATSDLQAWCEALERALEYAYVLAQRAKPGLEELPADFKVRVFTEFDLRERGSVEMATIDAARTRRDISRKAWVGEAKRRSFLPEDFDEEADKVELDKEAAEGMGEDDEGNDGVVIEPPGKKPAAKKKKGKKAA